MENNKMSKIEYDLKAIMYSAYDTPHKLCNISGNKTIQQTILPPNNAGRPMRQFKCPSLGASGEPGHPCSVLFSRGGGGGGGGGGGAQREGCIQGYWLMD